MSTVQVRSLLGKIQQRGHWSVVIRPTSFDERRIEYAQLTSLIEKKAVQLRGWSYPAVGSVNRFRRRGTDWVEQECEWNQYLELWRFYQSGQFLHFFGIPLDWLDHSTLWPKPPNWRPMQYLDYIDTLYTITEIFEFAARLSLSEAGALQMRVEVEISGLRDRRLTDSGTGIFFRATDHYQYHSDKWEWKVTKPQTTLIAEPRLLAVEAARDLFVHFDLDVSIEILKSLQERIGRGGSF
jgi:hypothetical protein